MRHQHTLPATRREGVVSKVSGRAGIAPLKRASSFE
jgi:hypothetical protein